DGEDFDRRRVHARQRHQGDRRAEHGCARPFGPVAGAVVSRSGCVGRQGVRRGWYFGAGADGAERCPGSSRAVATNRRRRVMAKGKLPKRTTQPGAGPAQKKASKPVVGYGLKGGKFTSQKKYNQSKSGQEHAANPNLSKKPV